MKVRFGKVGYPLYCDTGPCEGDVRIDLAISLYLSPEEYARYEGSECLRIALSDHEDGAVRGPGEHGPRPLADAPARPAPGGKSASGEHRQEGAP